MKFALIALLSTSLFAQEDSCNRRLELAPLEKIESIIESGVETIFLADPEIEHQSARIIFEDQKIQEGSERGLRPQFIDLAQIDQQSATLEKLPNNDLGSYDELIITAEARGKIEELLQTMAENNVFQLLFLRKRLEKIGREIDFVHPMRFIGTVFSDPRLVRYMREIRKTSFKWDGFVGGFGKRFKAEIKANNVNDYVPGLAKLLGIKEGGIRIYIEHKNFEGLVLYLMRQSRL